LITGDTGDFTSILDPAGFSVELVLHSAPKTKEFTSKEDMMNSQRYFEIELLDNHFFTSKPVIS